MLAKYNVCIQNIINKKAQTLVMKFVLLNYSNK